jgi:hypothetical protein
MTDQDIARDLAGRAGTPYPGRWYEPPFRELRAGGGVYAVVASDPGLSAIGVDRAAGGVWLLPEGGEPVLVNTGAAAFTACSKVYAESSA